MLRCWALLAGPRCCRPIGGSVALLAVAGFLKSTVLAPKDAEKGRRTETLRSDGFPCCGGALPGCWAR